ncbi:hypothetical protein KTD13_01820 [Burkholderia multivorans]|uniref:hypothetical protein n=1 Tax=Burkholderia multivorans TaxID=87883 RepID=UPI001C22EB45|nr:hypothetical protein [Burkholderia multivorans]MBU9259084.1 hypothetical protein [Burkholderia multivorans]
MEPLWEYRWAYEDEWFGVIECKFWMTDDEAKLWHAYGQKGTRRLDETRRDRNLQPKPTEQALSHASVAAGMDPLPEFVSPTTNALRRWWKHPERVDGADVRRMILEVIALRRLLNASVKVAAEARES